MYTIPFIPNPVFPKNSNLDPDLKNVVGLDPPRMLFRAHLCGTVTTFFRNALKFSSFYVWIKGVQEPESTPAGVRLFQKDPEQTKSGYV